jgi:hypothetical protein
LNDPFGLLLLIDLGFRFREGGDIRGCVVGRSIGRGLFGRGERVEEGRFGLREDGEEGRRRRRRRFGWDWLLLFFFFV